MSNQKDNYFVEKYKDNGTVMIPIDNIINPLNDRDLSSLQNFCNDVEKEFIKIGDAGETNHLLVGRFMTDVEKPLVVKNPYSKKLLDLLSQKNILDTIKKIINVQGEVFYRRVQFNQIDKDCFVGYHLDTDSNPDYLAACVIQLGDKFDGGLYRVYQKDKSFIDYKPNFGSLIISDCNYPHEVTKVLNGERKSLVFFISKNNGLNKRFK